MTTPTLLPLSDIKIESRVRGGLDDAIIANHVEDLADSIRVKGLLQPLLIGPENILQDGWCRYTAWQRLAVEDPIKYAQIPVYFRDDLSPDEYREIELETNLKRLDFSWRETIKAVCEVHFYRQKKAIREQTGTWSQDMTGELLGGYSKSYVSNCMLLETRIQALAYDTCSSITDAMRVYYQQQEDAALAIQAKRTGLIQPPAPKTFDVTNDVLLGLLATDVPVNQQAVKINLSSSLFLGDSVRCLLPQWSPDSVNHIITDPPYGIDMDYIRQRDDKLNAVDRTADEHNIKENENMFTFMFPTCYRILKDGGFFVFFCDQMQWQRLYDLAIAAGFGVQRWPLVWCKTQALNQMAHVNITKATEIAMVCRKGKAQLPSPVSSNWTIVSNDDAKLSNPFAKPFALWKWLYDSFTTEGQTVLDPFAGEGSSTITGLRLNRHTIAIEKTELHYNVLLSETKAHWRSVYPNCVFE